MQNARFFCLQKKLELVHFNLSIILTQGSSNGRITDAL